MKQIYVESYYRSGKSHSVITGFSIIDTGKNKTLSKSVETKIYIRRLTLAEIDAYVKSKEPLDKAGAYAIQGLGAVFVEKIEGDYFSVIGLSLKLVPKFLKILVPYPHIFFLLRASHCA